jgi:hypothetical protein
MITLSLLVFFVAAAALSLGLAIWRLSRPRPDAITPAFIQSLLNPSRPVLELYRPMSRLFADEDRIFVAAAAPKMMKQLRRERGRVLRLYLRELQGDFARVYALCRALAPKSQDPNFAASITRHAFTFYSLMLILQLRCTLGVYLHIRVDTTDLVSALDRLSETARAMLAGMTPEPALSGSPA